MKNLNDLETGCKYFFYLINNNMGNKLYITLRTTVSRGVKLMIYMSNINL